MRCISTEYHQNTGEDIGMVTDLIAVPQRRGVIDVLGNLIPSSSERNSPLHHIYMVTPRDQCITMQKRAQQI